MDEVRQDHVGQQGKVDINAEEYKKVMKKYKKIKKYMKSSIFAVKTMDETETLVSGLLKEAGDIQDEV
jgi:hypothetical protein|tara:strand:+ start:4579 stop:4782 length:204 start_codon:yes stop_codon:yes gene_type:complete